MTPAESRDVSPRESRAVLGLDGLPRLSTVSGPDLLSTHSANVFFFWGVWASPGALGNENILGIKGHDEPILPPQRVLSSGDTNKKEKQPSIQTEVCNCSSDGLLPGRQQV